MKLIRFDNYLSDMQVKNRLDDMRKIILLDLHDYQLYKLSDDWLEDIFSQENLFIETIKRVFVVNEESEEMKISYIDINMLYVVDQVKINKNFCRMLQTWISKKAKVTGNEYVYGSKEYHREKSTIYELEKLQQRIIDFATKYRPSNELIEQAKELDIL